MLQLYKYLFSVTMLFAGIPVDVNATTEPLNVTELSPGLFVFEGAQDDATPANRGAIANIGFIIGNDCVAVIDTGGSFAQGQALRAAILSRTSTPICYVFNTHVHPDHVYGNAAFKMDEPLYVGHNKLAASMASRRDYYAGFLQRTIGLKLAQESALVPPNMHIKGTHVFDLGQRTLTVQAWPTSHSDNDLTVFDNLSGTLWTGDLLFRGRIPMVDGSSGGWLKTMKEMAKIPARTVIPGHGPPTTEWPAALAPQERYLRQLREGVQEALAAKVSIAQATNEVGITERELWLLFDSYHAHNVTVVFTELEWEN